MINENNIENKKTIKFFISKFLECNVMVNETISFRAPNKIKSIIHYLMPDIDTNISPVGIYSSLGQVDYFAFQKSTKTFKVNFLEELNVALMDSNSLNDINSIDKLNKKSYRNFHRERYNLVDEEKIGNEKLNLKNKRKLKTNSNKFLLKQNINKTESSNKFEKNYTINENNTRKNISNYIMDNHMKSNANSNENKKHYNNYSNKEIQLNNISNNYNDEIKLLSNKTNNESIKNNEVEFNQDNNIRIKSNNRNQMKLVHTFKDGIIYNFTINPSLKNINIEDKKINISTNQKSQKNKTIKNESKKYYSKKNNTNVNKSGINNTIKENKTSIEKKTFINLDVTKNKKIINIINSNNTSINSTYDTKKLIDFNLEFIYDAKHLIHSVSDFRSTPDFNNITYNYDRFFWILKNENYDKSDETVKFEFFFDMEESFFTEDIHLNLNFTKSIFLINQTERKIFENSYTKIDSKIIVEYSNYSYIGGSVFLMEKIMNSSPDLDKLQYYYNNNKKKSDLVKLMKIEAEKILKYNETFELDLKFPLYFENCRNYKTNTLVMITGIILIVFLGSILYLAISLNFVEKD